MLRSSVLTFISGRHRQGKVSRLHHFVDILGIMHVHVKQQVEDSERRSRRHENAAVQWLAIAKTGERRTPKLLPILEPIDGTAQQLDDLSGYSGAE